jgi:HSP20 family protein
MFFTVSNAFEEMNTLRREMEDVFKRSQRVFTTQGRSFPLLNIYNQPEEIRVVAEVPGVAKDDLDISFSNGLLKISGERKVPDLPEKSLQVRSERQTGVFEKTLRIPFEVNADKLHAELHNGVLQIGLPKAESARARQILING